MKKNIISTADEVLKSIEARSKLSGLITPIYDGLSISNIPSTVLSTFNVKWKHLSPLSNSSIKDFTHDAETIILILLDGLGYNLLKKAIINEPRSALSKICSSGFLVPITSTFPSTTTTALTTINTGLTPQEHAIIGYTMYLKKIGMVANMISFSPAIDSRRDTLLDGSLDRRDLFRGKTIYETLGENGVKSHVVTRRIYKYTGLSRLLHVGAEVNTYMASSDLFIILKRLLENSKGLPKYIFVYWDLIDSLSHIYGPESEEVFAELRSFFYQLRTEFLEKIGNDVTRKTSFMITGDHGLASNSERSTIKIQDYPHLLDNLQIPPTGDSRAAFIYVKVGRTAYVRNYFNSKFGRKLLVVNSNKALKEGFFGIGEVNKELRSRIGDLIALPYEGSSIIYPYKKHEGSFMKGCHGGLSSSEVLVPLLCFGRKH